KKKNTTRFGRLIVDGSASLYRVELYPAIALRPGAARVNHLFVIAKGENFYMLEVISKQDNTGRYTENRYLGTLTTALNDQQKISEWKIRKTKYEEASLARLVTDYNKALGDAPTVSELRASNQKFKRSRRKLGLVVEANSGLVNFRENFIVNNHYGAGAYLQLRNTEKAVNRTLSIGLEVFRLEYDFSAESRSSFTAQGRFFYQGSSSVLKLPLQFHYNKYSDKGVSLIMGLRLGLLALQNENTITQRPQSPAPIFSPYSL
ncbi:MAG: hypothetical protein AAGF89_17250, partial [Bacteroidota bacterium]